MKILITGATGFIGKNLIKRLKQDGYKITLLLRSEPQQSVEAPYIVAKEGSEDFVKIFQNNSFDGVIHLASFFKHTHTEADIPTLIDTNITFATQLLEASKNKIKWFINTGTFWQHYNNEQYSPVNLYAATKQAFEDIAQYYIESTNINFVTLKLCDTFGPNDTRPKIFTLWEKNLENKTELPMSPGEQLIDISHVDNITDAFSFLIKIIKDDERKALCGKTYAIKSTKVLSLKDLSRLFEEIYQAKLLLKWGGLPYRNREVMIPWNTGETLPGWKPPLTLEQGIQKMKDLRDASNL